MGIRELVLLTIAQQVAQATAAFCNKAEYVTTNPTGKLAYAVGQQLAANMAALASWGIAAAGPEFAAGQASDKVTLGAEGTLATQLPTLPPVT